MCAHQRFMCPHMCPEALLDGCCVTQRWTSALFQKWTNPLSHWPLAGVAKS